MTREPSPCHTSPCHIVESHNYQNFDGIAVSQLNPFRYRGYYFDNETYFYYVSSRYYDPAIARFINADDTDLLGANGDVASLNLFAYCGNNPVLRADSNGAFWHIVAGAVIGGAGSFVSNLLAGGTLAEAGVSALFGAASGALSAACPAAACLIDVGFSVAEELTINQMKPDESKASTTDIAISVGVDSLSSVCGRESKLTPKTMQEFTEAIPKTFKGNHPKVKAPAKRIVKRTTKVIAKESGEAIAEKMVGNIFKEILKSIF